MINLNWPPIGGAAYQIPEEAEENWQALTDFLVALGNGAQPQTYQKVAPRIITATPATVVSASDCVLLVNLTVAGPSTINLPAGVSGQWFAIIDGKADADVNNITIVPNGVQTINGAANFVMNVARQSITLCYTGSNNWTVIGTFSIPLSGIIPRSQIAAGTPSHVVINAAGTGLLSSEATLAKSRGGTAQDNSSITFPASGTIPTTANNLSVFAATTSAQLRGIISDETGTGAAVFGTAPTISTPTISGGSTWNDISTPATPAAGNIKIYSKAGVPTYLNSAGVEFALANTSTSLTNPMTTAGDIIYSLALGVPERLAAGAANTLLRAGSPPSYGLLANANVDAAAGIALSKLATSTSAQLAAIISDETGTGLLVFGTSPTFSTSITLSGSSDSILSAEITNSNASGSNAVARVFIDTASNGTNADPYLLMRTENTAANLLGIGIDRSDSHKYKITRGGVGVSTGTTMAEATLAGAWTLPQIHNVGAGNITSGRYTPTLTNGTNISANLSSSFQYLRVGNIVNVTGSIDATTSAAGNITSVISISLPIASNLASSSDLNGVGTRTAASGTLFIACSIAGNSTSDLAEVTFNSPTTGSRAIQVSFQYEVK